MEWDKKGRNKTREAGFILLAGGTIILVAGIVLSFTVGTVLAPILLSSSILINTAAVICLRRGKGENKR